LITFPTPTAAQFIANREELHRTSVKICKFISSEFPTLDIQFLDAADFGRMSTAALKLLLNCNGTRLNVRKSHLVDRLQIFLDDPALLKNPEYEV
jgi:hypothetical protein